jgi:NADH-quinone oxidoreductase subunit A
MYIEYLFIFKYIIIFLVFGIFLFVSSFFFVFQKFTNEKISVYECGFNPFGDARQKFEVRFYLVAIIFIIFDLELLFLFPWIVCLNSIFFIGMWIMLFFLFILTLGFIYEWYEGALDWS